MAKFDGEVRYHHILNNGERGRERERERGDLFYLVASMLADIRAGVPLKAKSGLFVIKDPLTEIDQV